MQGRWILRRFVRAYGILLYDMTQSVLAVRYQGRSPGGMLSCEHGELCGYRTVCVRT